MQKEIVYVKELLGGQFICECDNKTFIALPMENYLRWTFLSACNSVLLNYITKNLRAVAVDYKFEEKRYLIHWLAYFDAGVTKDEIDDNSVAFTEVIAHIPNLANLSIEMDIKENYKIIPSPEKLTPLKQFIYLRKE
jgi:hypothetical protein